MGGAIGRVLRDCSGRRRAYELSRSGVVGGSILVRILRRVHGLLFPNCFSGGEMERRCVNCVMNSEVRFVRCGLGGRVTGTLGNYRGYGSLSCSRIVRGSRGLICRFLSGVPSVHSCLTASIITTFGNSPTTCDASRVVLYCPKFFTVAICEITRRL